MTLTRNGQNVVRRYTLQNYGARCALCDIKDPEMLVASHIIPWSKDKSSRGILGNVLCLCVLHDRLFEQGKISINDDYKVEKCKNSSAYTAFKHITETQLRLPIKELPDRERLRIHRDRFLSLET
jgi:predicted restriction endonuclease